MTTQSQSQPESVLVDGSQSQPVRDGGLYGWFQDRLDIRTLWSALFIRKIPFGVNLLYTLGFVSLALFGV